jgi:membrane protein
MSRASSKTCSAKRAPRQCRRCWPMPDGRARALSPRCWAWVPCLSRLLAWSLNTVWEIEETPGRGMWHFIRSYVVSLAAVMTLGFLLLASLMVTAGLAAFSKYAAPHVAEWLLHLFSGLVSVAVIALLFAMMFKWLPDAAVDWYDVWLGAVLTALLFEIGKSAIAFYIAKQGLESTYGAAASIIVVLIWVYYTSQIILMGAEVTHAFATHHGSIKARRCAATPNEQK